MDNNTTQDKDYVSKQMDDVVREKLTNSKIQSDVDKMNKKKNILILNEIYKNSEMGKKAIEYLLPKITDDALKSILLSHYESYDDFSNKTAGIITKYGETPHSTSNITNMWLATSINMKSLMNSSCSQIADMVIQGNNMGVLSINKLLNDNIKIIDNEIHDLAIELLELEQKDIDGMKKFL